VVETFSARDWSPEEIAAAGRKPCPACGYPVDPAKRFCPDCLKWVTLGD
jgi:uncharacterized OB-fold protein